MPLFDYRCEACDHRFEALVQNGNAAACPKCEGGRLERLISPFAMNVKGGTTSPAMGSCGSCGDPRGPGACSLG